MSWTSILIFVAVIVAFVLIRRLGQVSAASATQYLREGATVIDVRTEAEFNGGHLRRAINMPMDRIESLVPQRIRNKEQVLLLHCQSGMRSEVAKKKLCRLGYTRVFNLGSYARAARILGHADPDRA